MTKPDPSLLDVIAPEIVDAMLAASRALTWLGIRHVVVGGLAVTAKGSPRATKVVEFLVGDEAFEHGPGGFVSLKPGVPIQVNGVVIDLLSVQDGEEHLATALDAPMGSMIEAPQLIYMKLKSHRQKDRADVVELIKAGIDINACRRYLVTHASALVGVLEESVAKAASEE